MRGALTQQLAMISCSWGWVGGISGDDDRWFTHASTLTPRETNLERAVPFVFSSSATAARRAEGLAVTVASVVTLVPAAARPNLLIVVLVPPRDRFGVGWGGRGRGGAAGVGVGGPHFLPPPLPLLTHQQRG